jgi:uroporphyrin-III C-methyltransferase/precorrin-2 dehydrogenase/sirohydrochlorin ferrochelatase
MAEAKRRLVERAGGIVVGDDDRDAKIAFIALENPELAAVRLRARGVLVNVVDRLDLSDFTVPSILDRDPVLVAVGTGGASAGLAKQLRLRLEGLIPGNLGKLADALQSVRAAWRERWPDAADRRRALDAALAPGGPLDPLADGSADKVEGWLQEADAPGAAERVELTIASDDPDDLTLRQARLLGNADALLFEPGIAPAILARARSDAMRLPLPHEGELPVGLVLILRRG